MHVKLFYKQLSCIDANTQACLGRTHQISPAKTALHSPPQTVSEHSSREHCTSENKRWWIISEVNTLDDISSNVCLCVKQMKEEGNADKNKPLYFIDL